MKHLFEHGRYVKGKGIVKERWAYCGADILNDEDWIMPLQFDKDACPACRKSYAEERARCKLPKVRRKKKKS